MLARAYGAATRLATGNQSRTLAIPSLYLDAESKQRSMQDTAFADGLRGIAALYVVASHVVLCYAQQLVNPCCAHNSNRPELLQRPILRLIASGHSWVAVFFILLGFVNSLKPLSLARKAQPDAVASKLASSSLSRVFRLLFPASFATILSWFVCQLGFFDLARDSDAYWLRDNTPNKSSNIFAAFADLKDGLINTWKYDVYNQYDQPQWAMIYLLQGSLMVIVALLITASMTSLWRTLFLSIAALASLNWSPKTGDPYVGLACIGGIILSEFSLSTWHEHLSTISPYLSPPVAIFALVLMSYPSEHPEAAPWSSSLHDFALATFGNVSIDRVYGTLGGFLLLASIIISPHARHCLGRKPMRWLGKISFAIYLVHGTILRSLFAWLLFVGSEQIEVQEIIDQGTSMWPNEILVTNMRYPLPSSFRCTVATIILFAAILGASHLWNQKVEPVCASLTNLIEKLVRGQYSMGGVSETVSAVLDEKKSLLPTRQD